MPTKNIKYNIASKDIIVNLQVCDYVKINNIQHIDNYSILPPYLMDTLILDTKKAPNFTCFQHFSNTVHENLRCSVEKSLASPKNLASH